MHRGGGGLKGQRVQRRWRLLLGIFAVVLIADQATKFWAVDRLTRLFEVRNASTVAEKVRLFFEVEHLERLRARPVVVHPDHWQFKYVENPGAAWGIFGGLPEGVRVPFFALVSVAAIAFLLYFFRRLPEERRLLQVALALVLGGAVGNFLDRLVHGYVIDFIDWHWKNDPALHWPTFNVADVAISIGIAVLLAHSLFGRWERQPEAPVAGDGAVAGAGAAEPATIARHPRAVPAEDKTVGNRACANSGSEGVAASKPRGKE